MTMDGRHLCISLMVLYGMFNLLCILKLMLKNLYLCNLGGICKLFHIDFVFLVCMKYTQVQLTMIRLSGRNCQVMRNMWLVELLFRLAMKPIKKKTISVGGGTISVGEAEVSEILEGKNPMMKVLEVDFQWTLMMKTLESFIVCSIREVQSIKVFANDVDNPITNVKIDFLQVWKVGFHQKEGH